MDENDEIFGDDGSPDASLEWGDAGENLIDEPVGDSTQPTVAPVPKVTTAYIEPPLALYRRYRPDTFADIIGQEHVTEPLQRALANNRVNHAYLFSGPRGCGKTSSARILARALNCEQGPAPIPCGECRSCLDLARGGPGSIDVIEIDAASHGGVNEARDLRERAFFAPVQSRYKIYIIDEAHMVTKEGFNALLKVVEEPPPHVKFIFATTEPEKVIGTIRSRTHHYPFRLVPPKVLSKYLSYVCESESVQVESLVLPLVVRAGAGSVRDALSVLDQLLGGADTSGISYGQAASLLGYTPDSLLDEIIDAFSASDSKGVFSSIDKVIESGLDPRRFAEDLLRRLRDLILVAAVPDATENGLIDVPADQADRLRSQAGSLSPAELTHAAEITAEGLSQMRGTTAPRLQLELLSARILLPAADTSERGLAARLGRIEQQLAAGVGRISSDTPRLNANTSIAGAVPSPAITPPIAPATSVDALPAFAPNPTDISPSSSGSNNSGSKPSPELQSSELQNRQSQTRATTLAEGHISPVSGIEGYKKQPESAKAPVQESVKAPIQTPSTAQASALGSSNTLVAADIRRHWQDILEELKDVSRVAWNLATNHAHIVEFSNNILTVGIKPAEVIKRFTAERSIALEQALFNTLSIKISINVVPVSGSDEAAAFEANTHPPQVNQTASVAPAAPYQQTAPPTSDEPPVFDAPSRDDATLDTTESINPEDLIVNELGGKLIADSEA